MSDGPDSNDAVAYLTWWCERYLLVMPRSLVVVIPDLAKRIIPLRFAANKLHAPFAECPGNATQTAFYSFLAETFCLRRAGRTRRELSSAVRGYLRQRGTPVFLDRAERLSAANLRTLYDIYHDTRGAFVVSSPGRALLERICRLRDGGRFLKNCAYYWLDVSLPKRLQAHLEGLRAFSRRPLPTHPRL